MTAEQLTELITEVKTGLSIPSENTFHDKLIEQKVRGVVGYIKNAGVSIENIMSDEGKNLVVMGVNDAWNLASGKLQFSKLFFNVLTQLSMIPEEEA